MYCKELKPPEKNQNNTEFLIEFNKYIDNETPNHPSCECVRRGWGGQLEMCVLTLTKASLPGDAAELFQSFFYPPVAPPLPELALRRFEKFPVFCFLYPKSFLKRVEGLWSSSSCPSGSARGLSCDYARLNLMRWPQFHTFTSRNGENEESNQSAAFSFGEISSS